MKLFLLVVFPLAILALTIALHVRDVRAPAEEDAR